MYFINKEDGFNTQVGSLYESANYCVESHVKKFQNTFICNSQTRIKTNQADIKIEEMLRYQT